MPSRLRKFLSYYRPYLGLLIADTVCAAVVAAVELTLPLCARYITKNVLATDAVAGLHRVYAMGAVMVALVALHTLCNMFVDYRGHSMGALMEGDMRRDLFDHYQKLSFRFYDGENTGRLMSRITNDLFSLAEFYHHGPEDLLIGTITIVGVLVISITLSVHLTVIIFLFVPIMILYAFYFHRRMLVALRTSRERIADVNAQAEETLSGIRVVASFTNEAAERRKFARANERFVQSRRRGYRSEALFDGGLISFTHLMTIAVIIFGAVSVARSALDLPDLLTYLLYVAILTEPVRRLVNFARLYQEGITGFGRFMDILEIAPDIHDSPGAAEVARVDGTIAFRGVSFRYREEHDYVLKEISLDISVGEFVAVVGTSGVGKTTLCSLIPRFYEVTAGSVLIDGIDVRDITLRSLRRNVGVVLQDVYLFSGSVAENIGYGRPGATREEIMEAARRANAHEFILSLPDGYDTDVGQRGVRLSGGQKQRLSIARVFLKDPPVIIFDEATSSLDNASERAIRESLERLASDRTTLVIAHRLSTIRKAQRILVLTENGIEEEGTHEELIALGGAYASLYNLQLEM